MEKIDEEVKLMKAKHYSDLEIKKAIEDDLEKQRVVLTNDLHFYTQKVKRESDKAVESMQVYVSMVKAGLTEKDDSIINDELEKLKKEAAGLKVKLEKQLSLNYKLEIMLTTKFFKEYFKGELEETLEESFKLFSEQNNANDVCFKLNMYYAYENLN